MENIKYHILEAQEFMKNHKPAQALPHALKALELEPANENAHFFAALAYFQLNQYKQAIIHFPQCMTVLKTKPGSWEKHAESLSFLGRGDEAIAIFRTIIDAHPGFMHAYHNFGYCLTCCQQYDEAIDYFNASEEGGFKPEELYFYRGTCYFNLQYYEEAREDLEIFSKLKPPRSPNCCRCRRWAKFSTSSFLKSSFQLLTNNAE